MTAYGDLLQGFWEHSHSFKYWERGLAFCFSSLLSESDPGSSLAQ